MKQEIPIFFAVDNAYIPFLAVSINSLIKNSNSENFYFIRILYTNINEENKRKILKFENKNIKIEFINVSNNIEELKSKLFTRDYYTNTTYYRILIPELYPKLKKALYLDCDIIILDDIAKLYNKNIDKYLIGSVKERWFKEYEELRSYAKKVIGLKKATNYINAGIMIMNLQELRKYNFKDKFMHLIETTKYTFAQDQDYFNRICKGRIKFINEKWNACGYLYNKSNPKIIHYTVFKPWQIGKMKNEEYFWNFAENTEFYSCIKELKEKTIIDEPTKGESSLKEFLRIAKYEANCIGNG